MVIEVIVGVTTLCVYCARSPSYGVFCTAAPSLLSALCTPLSLPYPRCNMQTTKSRHGIAAMFTNYSGRTSVAVHHSSSSRPGNVACVVQVEVLKCQCDCCRQ
jgi:hypothetical protein